MASVYFMKARNKYAAQINRDGVKYYLGLHKTFEEAQRVAEEAELKIAQNNPLASPQTQTGLTQERIKELFNFDPLTGVFKWKARTSRRISVGDAAGHNTCQGYVAIRIDGELHLAHRVAWMYVHGSFPDQEIDHIDGNGRNNALANLRECNRNENVQNTTVRRDNKLRITGVHKRSDTGKYSAEITVGGVKKSLGCFDTSDEARAVYIEAKKMFHTFNPEQRKTND